MKFTPFKWIAKLLTIEPKKKPVARRPVSPPKVMASPYVTSSGKKICMLPSCSKKHNHRNSYCSALHSKQHLADVRAARKTSRILE